MTLGHTLAGPLQLPLDTPNDSTEVPDLEPPRAKEPWYTPNDSEETRENVFKMNGF